jgi:MYXO-CTERM domain-containing protein
MTSRFWLAGAIAIALTARVNETPTTTAAADVTSSSVAVEMAKLPLRFEANAGQWDERVGFRASSSGATVVIGEDGATLGGVHIRVVGARASRPVGEDQIVTRSNYFIGDDSSKWRTNVPNFARVRSKGVVPDVDVVWHGEAGALEWDLDVGPSANAELVEIEIDGARSLALRDDDGALVIDTGGAELVQEPPRVFQDGVELDARYRVIDDRHVGFDIEGYRRGRAILIDPTLVYSTYVGGNNNETVSYDAVAVDSSGNAYVAGATISTTFPTVSAYQSSNAGGSDAFVFKLSANGSSLTYATYLGGLADDRAYGIAVDSSGNAYVTGETESTGFPTVNAYQNKLAGGLGDAFVAKLSSSGSSLTYSTFLGGSNGIEYGYAIAVDSSGRAYAVGSTESTDFPTASAIQSTSGGGTEDAFVTCLASSGSSLVYSTYLGGNVYDVAYGVAVDSSNNAYVVGDTTSTNFPTVSALQGSSGGNDDAFVTKISSGGSSIVFSTYLGGSGYDFGYGVALDSSNVYVAGSTASTNFPTKNPYQSSTGGAYDAFVSKISSNGSSLVYSTYLGGGNNDYAYGVAIDSSNNMLVTGATASSNFPVASAVQSSNGGSYDAFVTELASGGASLVYSTYLGGSNADYGYGIGLDSSGNAIVAGQTSSTGFPTTSGAYKTTNSGGADVFVAKVGFLPLTLSPSAPTVPPNGTQSFTASGGSGGYVYSLLVNSSGGNMVGSLYTAGSTPSVSDVVQVKDSLNHVTTANVTVGPGVTITPSSPSCGANGTINFSATGGSGSGFTWAITTNNSGGSIVATTGVYTAGPTSSTIDTVKVTDSLGNTASVVVNVGAGVVVSPASPSVTPKSAVAFSATGGTTPYTWSILINNSGGTINSGTGAYTAGATGSVTDTVKVADKFGNAGTTTVTIGPSLAASPASASTTPKGSLSFSASGGSLSGYDWKMSTNASGGSIQLTTGDYVAGPHGGVNDVILLEDSVGSNAYVTISVGPSVSIAPALPSAAPKETIAFTASGGSGTGYVWSLPGNLSGGTINATTGAYTAGATGNVADTVALADSLGNTTSVNVSVGGGIAANPSSASVAPKEAIAFVVIGGSGSGYQWAFGANNSGGTLDAKSGAYVAGTKGSVKDTVTVTDSLGSSASVVVDVGPQVTITPASTSVAPGASAIFNAAGGSGKGYVWSLTTNASGGNISPLGVYTAGAAPNVSDTIQLVDSLGNSATASVSVGAAPPTSDGGSANDASDDGGSSGGGGGGCGCTMKGNAPASAAIGALLLGVAFVLRRSRRALGVLPAVCALAAQPDATTTPSLLAASSANVVATTMQVPVRFEANVGQWDPSVRFVTRGGGARQAYLTNEGATFVVHGSAVTLKVAGARSSALVPEEELRTKSNFLLGRDPSKWHTNVPSYARVVARDVLSGVDVVWHGTGGRLEYDLVVAANTDARNIQLEIDGADSLAVSNDGSLIIRTRAGDITQLPPRVTQDGAPRRARYVIDDAHHVSFTIEGYDRARGLLIDPVVLYGTYLGGTNEEEAKGVAVDTSGNMIIAGYTLGSFPTLNAYDSTSNGGLDAFVAKFDSSGSLVYSTYLGGSGNDQATAVAVDSSGNAYVVGFTASTDFPTVSAYQATIASSFSDAFVTKLNSSGSSLTYSTYLGGGGTFAASQAYAVAVDSSGQAYVGGDTSSSSFPTYSAYQASIAGSDDAFVTKFNAAGSALLYSTYLGGGSYDYIHGLAIDSSGSAYVVGDTSSNNFPVKNAYQGTIASINTDAFLTKLAAAGSSLVYSTYLGGGLADAATGVALDSSGNAYVVFQTTSTDVPTVSAYQSTLGGKNDAFLLKMNSTGSAPIFATYLGGTNDDFVQAVAVDSSGTAWITGRTTGGFPMLKAIQSTCSNCNGNNLGTAFISKVTSTGSLLFSTYFGGGTSGDVGGQAAAIDPSGSCVVAGWVDATSIPTVNAYQGTLGGSYDAFLARLGVGPLSLTGASLAPKATHTFTALGGSEQGYVYALKTNASGGSINSSTGAYQAGATGSVTDVVQVTDSANNVATANVTVGPGITVTPGSSTVAPQQTVNFTVSGGSGSGYVFSWVTNNSNGQLGNPYVAGPTPNCTDTMVVTDSLGNTSPNIVMTVGPGVSITPAQASLSANQSMTFTASGGKGSPYTWSSTNFGSITSNGVYTAGGSVNVTDTVTVKDSLGNVATAPVFIGQATVVITPFTATTPPRGTLSFTAAGGKCCGFTWSFVTNASGGIINSTTGAYTAGPIGDVADIIMATDAASHSATAGITVTAGVGISPPSLTTTAGATKTFAAGGGSGKGFTWSMTGSSGGKITPAGAYTAGPNVGKTDTVKVVDSLGNFATATVDVVDIGADAGDDASAPEPDASDADAGPPDGSSSGCGCRTIPARTPSTAALAVLALLAFARRRRSRRR